MRVDVLLKGANVISLKMRKMSRDASVLTVQRYCIPGLSVSMLVFCQYSRTIFQGCQYRCEFLDSTVVLYSRVVSIVASVLSVQSHYIPGLLVLYVMYPFSNKIMGYRI